MVLTAFPFRNLPARAAAHRAMARAALFSDSSLRTRYQRYQHHMQKAKALQAQADVRVSAAAKAPEVHS